ncbi:anti-anti-sigma factor [Streptomyces viridochromogenes]|uniref:Anti-sigma factor antagonist n=1 Tax=Streptomyces viridochromogenes TaxID=1938 RepID=A0A0J7ZP63_STRVR|nr:STAS domain-containing protein [Streptomyces viridochromogenes]KMS77197.1 anti-anti-sigma factor [Streptomyces viridochromogenes]KOG09441.1 anti-anti-sigma factor [Streptomyces viridochromogenes]KOG27347.1 anti-anti-sigma factor [Streptomyces viridochromogenes]
MTPDADDRAPHPTESMAADSSRPVPPPANAHARTRRCGPFTVVEVLGEVDLATAALVAEHLDAATGRPEPDVLVDLRGVDFFDCSGLRVLCRAETRARDRGGRLRVVSDAQRLRRLLRGAGLLGRFPPLPGVPGEDE